MGELSARVRKSSCSLFGCVLSRATHTMPQGFPSSPYIRLTVVSTRAVTPSLRMNSISRVHDRDESRGWLLAYFCISRKTSWHIEKVSGVSSLPVHQSGSGFSPSYPRNRQAEAVTLPTLKFMSMTQMKSVSLSARMRYRLDLLADLRAAAPWFGDSSIADVRSAPSDRSLISVVSSITAPTSRLSEQSMERTRDFSPSGSPSIP